LKKEEKIKQQSIAIAEVKKAVSECHKTHSKTLKIGYNGYLNVFLKKSGS